MPDQPASSIREAPPPGERYLVKILRWDWNLHFGLGPEGMPVEQRYAGRFLYTRGFEIEGRVIAPKTHRKRRFRLWLIPFNWREFEPNEGASFGSLHDEGPQSAIVASAYLPEEAMQTVAACLGSVWRYAHVWTAGEMQDRATLSDISFSASLHKNLRAWIAGGR